MNFFKDLDMKRNKKVFLYTLLLAGVAISITGCKKFLDRKPLSATLTDYGSALDGQAIGMYSIFNSWAGFNTLPWLDFNSIRDDDAQKGSSTTDGARSTRSLKRFSTRRMTGLLIHTGTITTI